MNGVYDDTDIESSSLTLLMPVKVAQVKVSYDCYITIVKGRGRIETLHRELSVSPQGMGLFVYIMCSCVGVFVFNDDV